MYQCMSAYVYDCICVWIHGHTVPTSGREVVDYSVAIISPKQGAWEHDRVEWNVVLGHELVQLYLLGILPPLPPVGGVARCDGEVPVRSEG